jgi:hypothetical protein
MFNFYSYINNIKEFNLITAKKKEAVHDVLKLGFDVMFADTDVAIVQDPFSFLVYNNIDYVHSLNSICIRQDTLWSFTHSKEEGNK